MGTTTHAPTDRITCPPDHKHNSTCYNSHRCRCAQCTRIVHEQQRRLYRLKAYGLPTTNLVDATPTREHLLALQKSGLGIRQMASLSGVRFHRVVHVLYGVAVKTPTRYRPPIPAKRIDKDVAERLLGLTLDPMKLRPQTLVPAVGTMRRIQALTLNGWLLAELADFAGMHRESLGEIANGKRNFVNAGTYQVMADVFERLWNIVPEADTSEMRRARTIARRHAKAHGWLPAMAWDDIDADLRPPQVRGVDRQEMSVRERETKVTEMHRLRLSDHRIAQSLGIADRTVTRIRKRLGLPGWSKEQQEAAA